MKYVLLLLVAFFTFSCALNQTQHRRPSSEEFSDGDALRSYKLPITRGGQKTTRVAYNYWSGEYPAPIIDVNSSKLGTTTINAYLSLRDVKEPVTCTIKNGVYNPWSTMDPSIEAYYTIAAIDDFSVIKEIKLTKTSYSTTGKTHQRKITIPQGSKIINVIYGSENFCSGTLQVGKNLTAIDESCDFFYESKKYLQRVSKENDQFLEQWLYFKCEEKTEAGTPLKAFVNADALLAEKDKGVREGCLGPNYGTVARAEDASCQQ